ncbi:NAD(P)H-dependent oxidoreductase [Tenacibaculum sp. ZH5_bin.1]|uniref:NAD(P)H-dependent oxidoreductase n=1 Tax=Tenacibaculum TaxID=104267 RepID=UPI0012E659DC|nr:NAD(P)H-dependent oxidoreductase [Tenacibaculum mesophilum]KAF9660022.1 NAD(P)H-dependent oxidoreductase [Tenacibaculum mesophilum]GFD73906.1 flavodoxin [Tenacibaculum sp. KUL113]
MKNILIINGHQYYPFAEGKLNQSFIEKLSAQLKEANLNIKITVTQNDYNVDEEVEKFLWADVVFLQTPLNWMGITWSFKKYMDDVFTAGMMGKLSQGDGRTSEAPKKNYGLGGLLNGKYMMSVTANAPKEAFNNPDEPFFAGKSEDDLLLPMHLNFKWFGLEPLKTFFAYDVMKNPEIESDFVRFEKHINEELLQKI